MTTAYHLDPYAYACPAAFKRIESDPYLSRYGFDAVAFGDQRSFFADRGRVAILWTDDGAQWFGPVFYAFAGEPPSAVFLEAA